MASNWLQEGQTKQLYMFKKVLMDGGCLWKHKHIHAISVGYLQLENRPNCQQGLFYAARGADALASTQGIEISCKN